MEMQELKLGSDYDYKLIGEFEIPRISILEGKYKGLKFDLDTSFIRQSFSEEHNSNELVYDFKFLKAWDNMDPKQFNEESKKFTLTTEDQNFMTDVVMNFIEETNNKEQK